MVSLQRHVNDALRPKSNDKGKGKGKNNYGRVNRKGKTGALSQGILDHVGN